MQQRWLRITWAIAGVLCVLGCHRASLDDPAMGQLIRLLNDGTIVRMEVVHVPYSLTSYAAIQPYQMRTGGLEISRDTVPGPFQSLSQALHQEATATAVHHPPDFIDGKSTVVLEGEPRYPVDVRWSCILYDNGNREIGSIFLGKRYWWGSGKMGIVNGRLLNLNGALALWFEGSFLTLFNEQLAVPPTASTIPPK